MEMKSEFIVLRDVKNGAFVAKYENKTGTLSFNYGVTDNLENAAAIEMEYYLKNKKRFDGMAQMLDVGVIKVKASYELTHLDGSEVQEIEEKETTIFEQFMDFLEKQANDDD